ncbi:Hypothetical predicted protein [Octopus vulgaris]|uniref:Uncharacterized protein n=1 Tax=Octopus vulgaris TaxID=6645 RepID=A0AA36F5W5_OCTVU|nr:Hypothetical predicted protein [Octopus vulgaris]
MNTIPNHSYKHFAMFSKIIDLLEELSEWKSPVSVFIWVQRRGKSDKKPDLITQPELSDLVGELTLTKQQSEVLTSRLQQWKLLDKDAHVTVFRKHSADLQQFFTLENNLTYCNNLRDLFNALELTYEPNE